MKSVEKTVRPFVKWAGGKTGLLDQLLARIPDLSKLDWYYEPFVGGGALFFSVAPESATLNDYNPHLINAYRVIRETPEQLYEVLLRMGERHSKEYFYKVRTAFNSSLEQSYSTTQEDRLFHAAAFLYLNKTCFNGLWRENRQGQFNVPLGSYTNPKIADWETIWNAHLAMASGTELEITCGSYEQVRIRGNCFYYLDPPYDETFTGYTKKGFDFTCQEQVADYCKAIDRAGSKFLLSNSWTGGIRDLYKDYVCEQIEAPRGISGRGPKSIPEILVRNYE